MFVLPMTVSCFCSLGQSRLEVTVTNVRTSTGAIRVGLFANDETFLKEAIKGQVVKATASETTVVFEDLSPGEYGLSVFHDENENGELDRSALGLPKEGFAFGNNAMGMFGPPSFEKAKVTLISGKTVSQVLKLKYL